MPLASRNLRTAVVAAVHDIGRNILTDLHFFRHLAAVGEVTCHAADELISGAGDEVVHKVAPVPSPNM